jgi:hypothetical protein
VLKFKHIKAPDVAKVGIKVRGLEAESGKLRPLTRQKKRRDEQVKEFRPSRIKRTRMETNMENRADVKSDIPYRARRSGELN